METYQLKKKVLAYITRPSPEGTELLIFAHRDHPEAGLQVPGGTLDPDENPLNGVLREVEEEAGLYGFTESRLLGETEYVAAGKEEIHLRSFFQLTYDKPCPTTFAHTVSAGEADEGLVFLYQWIKLSDLPELAAEQGVMVAEMIRGLAPPTGI